MNQRLRRVAVSVKSLHDRWHSYTNYGHYRADKPPYPVLWLYRDGIVETRELRGGEYGTSTDMITHDDLFSGFNASMISSPYYWGRYAPDKETVTVLVPRRFWHRNLPSSLLRDLEHKFPNAREILVFDRGD